MNEPPQSQQQPRNNHDHKYFFWVDHNHELLVGFTHDDEIEFGPNYSPDTASKVFWNAVRNSMPVAVGRGDAADIHDSTAAYLLSLYPEDSMGYNMFVPVARHFKDKAHQLRETDNG